MQAVSSSPAAAHSQIPAPIRNIPDGPHRVRLPPPQATCNSPAQEVYERTHLKTQATPVYDNTPRQRVQQAVGQIAEMSLPHWVPGALLRPEGLFKDAAERLMEVTPERWREALEPLTNPLILRQNLVGRFFNYLRRDDCREALNQQNLVTVHLVALEQWCWALLRKAKCDGCNVQNKLFGLRYTLQLVEETLATNLQDAWSRHTVKLKWLYGPALRRRISALESGKLWNKQIALKQLGPSTRAEVTKRTE